MWGDLTRGVSMEAGVDHSDLPRKCENYKCYNFTDMALTEDTCVGIGRSILLNFVFPEYNTKKSAQEGGGSSPVMAGAGEIVKAEEGGEGTWQEKAMTEKAMTEKTEESV